MVYMVYSINNPSHIFYFCPILRFFLSFCDFLFVLFFFLSVMTVTISPYSVGGMTFTCLSNRIHENSSLPVNTYCEYLCVRDRIVLLAGFCDLLANPHDLQ